jgi:hypothetical protein
VETVVITTVILVKITAGLYALSARYSSMNDVTIRVLWAQDCEYFIWWGVGPFNLRFWLSVEAFAFFFFNFCFILSIFRAITFRNDFLNLENSGFWFLIMMLLCYPLRCWYLHSWNTFSFLQVLFEQNSFRPCLYANNANLLSLKLSFPLEITNSEVLRIVASLKRQVQLFLTCRSTAMIN